MGWLAVSMWIIPPFEPLDAFIVYFELAVASALQVVELAIQ
jgi:hypothetical protein